MGTVLTNPPPDDTGARTARILGLVVLGAVVLCGVIGTCLFVVLLVLPAVSGG